MYMRKTYNLHIGERTARADQVRDRIGGAARRAARDGGEGTPRARGRAADGHDHRRATSARRWPSRCGRSSRPCATSLERVPPELSADIYDRGVVLTGGGALLRNLDKRLREETGLPVLVAENPLTSVVLGAGMMLTDLPLLRKVAMD